MGGAGRSFACWLSLCVLLGCAERRAPPEPADVTVAGPPISLAPEAPHETVRQRDLCEVMAGLLAQEQGGFIQLRGRTIAAERWAAEQSVPGLGDCVIEGSAWPRARFVCASRRLTPDQAHAKFNRLAAEIDRCLTGSSWLPRSWEKGSRFEFAMGERQQAWLDQSSAPPTAVVLGVQQDLVHWDYRLLLNLHSIR
jgi:hypothetical protein